MEKSLSPNKHSNSIEILFLRKLVLAEDLRNMKFNM